MIVEEKKMLSQNKMKEQARKYILTIESDGTAYILKSNAWVKVSIKRAIEWVNAGIDSLEGYSKEEMLKLLNTYL